MIYYLFYLCVEVLAVFIHSFPKIGEHLYGHCVVLFNRQTAYLHFLKVFFSGICLSSLVWICLLILPVSVFIYMY